MRSALGVPAGIDVVPYRTQDQIYADLSSGRSEVHRSRTRKRHQKRFLKKPQGAGFEFAGPAVTDEKLLGAGVGFGIRQRRHRR